MNVNFDTVRAFEEAIAKFFNSPYAIATDSCTHALELALRYTDEEILNCPKRTYLSIPFLAHKLCMQLKWKDENWQDYYYLTKNIIDAAVLWKMNSYIPGTFMGVSFQRQKHLNIGRGGILLTDDRRAYRIIKQMSYDGREPGIPWREQNIQIIGYHYYMLPELAALGLKKLPEAIKTPPKIWNVLEWPDLTTMDIFK